MLQQDVVADVEFKQTHSERGQQREDHIVAHDDPRVVERLAAEAVVEGEEELRHAVDEVLVEAVLDELRVADEAVAAVDGEQAPQVAEARDGVVAGALCLRALEADHADAHLRLLNHRHVVRAVADAEARVAVLLEHGDDVGLLQRRHAAAHCAVHQMGELLEDLGGTGRRLHRADRRPVDDDGDLLVVLLREVRLLDAVAEAVRDGAALRHLRVVEDHECVLARVQQLACAGDVDGRLALVTCQHPHHEPRIQEELDGLGHLVLQLVLDGGAPGERQAALHAETDLLHQPRAVRHGHRRLVPRLEERLQLGLRQVLVAERERAQTLLGEVAQRVLRRQQQRLVPRVLSVQVLDDGAVGAFGCAHDAVRGAVAQDDAHHLPVGGEGQDALDAPRRRRRRVGAHAGHERDAVGRAPLQDKAVPPGARHQRNLVGRAAVVVQVAVLLHADHDVVGHGQHLQEQRQVRHLLGVVAVPDLAEQPTRRLLLVVRVARTPALGEFHAVLCQGAGLVREDVLHLRELLVQAARAGLHLRHRRLHLCVPLHELRLRRLAELHRHEERDGDHHGEQHKVRRVGREEVRRRVAVDHVCQHRCVHDTGAAEEFL
eukprot:PhM_4_TR7614/c0_g1_i3/m.4559